MKEINIQLQSDALSDRATKDKFIIFNINADVLVLIRDTEASNAVIISFKIKADIIRRSMLCTMIVYWFCKNQK